VNQALDRESMINPFCSTPNYHENLLTKQPTHEKPTASENKIGI